MMRRLYEVALKRDPVKTESTNKGSLGYFVGERSICKADWKVHVYSTYEAKICNIISEDNLVRKA